MSDIISTGPAAPGYTNPAATTPAAPTKNHARARRANRPNPLLPSMYSTLMSLFTRYNLETTNP
jgi:hypothetical protein